MHRVHAVLVAVALTLALSAPTFACAAPGDSRDSDATRTSAGMFASATNANGTVVDELLLALAATLAGAAFVSFVFISRREES